MIDNLANYESGPMEDMDGFLSYQTNIQKQAETLVSSAQNNLSNYHSQVIDALSTEDRAEDALTAQTERYTEAKGCADEILDDLGQEIRSIRSEIKNLQASGASSATLDEYKSQLADTMGDYNEVTQQIGYIKSDMEQAQTTYTSAVETREGVEANLAAARDSYNMPTAAMDDVEFTKNPSDIGSLIGMEKSPNGLAKVLDFSKGN